MKPVSNKEGYVLRLEDFLPYRLVVAASLVSQATARTYATKYSIGIAEWRVIAQLGEFGTMTMFGEVSAEDRAAFERVLDTVTARAASLADTAAELPD